MTNAVDVKCFGFYTGEWKCKEGGCKVSLQCKAFANSDGLDVASDALDEMLSLLPDQRFLDTLSVRALVQQLVRPERAAQMLEQSALEATQIPNALGIPNGISVMDPL